MTTYWNTKTGKVIHSPSSALARKLRKDPDWQYTQQYGYTNAYRWGPVGTFHCYKVNGRHFGLLINAGSSALERQARLAEWLTQRGADLSKREFAALYQNRVYERDNLRLNKVFAQICERCQISASMNAIMAALD